MNVFRSELPGVGKLRHHGRGSAAKETQYLVEHAISCHIPADERLEDISVPNLFNPAQCVLRLHPIDDAYGDFTSKWSHELMTGRVSSTANSLRAETCRESLQQPMPR